MVLPTKPKNVEIEVTSLVVVMELRSANNALRTILPLAKLPPLSKLKNVPPNATTFELKLVKTRLKPSGLMVSSLPKE